MSIMRTIIICVLFVCISFSAQAVSVTPARAQLPFKPAARETIDYSQRVGSTVRIKAVRKFKVLAGSKHKSKDNIVAIYIGLPVVDSGQDNVIIEDVNSKMAKAENMIFSVNGDSLLVEYFDVKPGFEDEISLTFTADIYERRADLNDARPYNKEGQLYKKYTQNRGFAGVIPSDGEPNPILRNHLIKAGVRIDADPIEKALKIYEYLCRELSYGSFTDNEDKTNDIIKNKKAHCGQYAYSFVRLCREAGIPARRCSGFSFSYNTGKKKQAEVSGHNWAEFYVEGIGWIPVDPTKGDKKDSRKQYYFGAVDNARLCVSKDGFHDLLPLWYKTSEQKKIIFTKDASAFKPFKHPETIQGVHRFQYRFDKPIQISVPDPYGPSLNIVSIQGELKRPQY
jgi:hypothetical protein